MKFYAIALQWNFDSPYLAKLLKINFLWDICNTCLTKPWKLLSRETMIVHLLQNPWADRSCFKATSASFTCSRVRILAPLSIRNPSCCTVFHIHMLKGFVTIRHLKVFANFVISTVLHWGLALQQSSRFDPYPATSRQCPATSRQSMSCNLTTVPVLQNPWAGRSCSKATSATFGCSMVLTSAPMSNRNPLQPHYTPHSPAQGFHNHSPPFASSKPSRL